jgi:2,3-dihydroxybenzoate-AMP ligase
VQGREKDQINRGGEKIAAEEIENLLLRHPAVIHAALVSMEDSLLGEKSCAYLVVKEPLRAVAVRRCANKGSQNLNCRTAWSALMRCR